MHILVIDGQGGKLGKRIVEAIRAKLSQAEITVVGTNSSATEAMLKGGADHAATGENAVIVASRKTDFIIGPVGIVIADSMIGEITPAMAVAVAQSNAKRILIPINKCDNIIAGVGNIPLTVLIEDAVSRLI